MEQYKFIVEQDEKILDFTRALEALGRHVDVHLALVVDTDSEAVAMLLGSLPGLIGVGGPSIKREEVEAIIKASLKEPVVAPTEPVAAAIESAPEREPKRAPKNPDDPRLGTHRPRGTCPNCGQERALIKSTGLCLPCHKRKLDLQAIRESAGAWSDVEFPDVEFPDVEFPGDPVPSGDQRAEMSDIQKFERQLGQAFELAGAASGGAMTAAAENGMPVKITKRAAEENARIQANIERIVQADRERQALGLAEPAQIRRPSSKSVRRLG